MRIPKVVICMQTDYNGSNISHFFDHEVQPKRDPLVFIKSVCFNCSAINRLRNSYLKSLRPYNKTVIITQFMWNRNKCYVVKYLAEGYTRIFFTSLLKPLIYEIVYQRFMRGKYAVKFYMIANADSHPFIHSANSFNTQTRVAGERTLVTINVKKKSCFLCHTTLNVVTTDRTNFFPAMLA